MASLTNDSQGAGNSALRPEVMTDAIVAAYIHNISDRHRPASEDADEDHQHRSQTR